MSLLSQISRRFSSRPRRRAVSRRRRSHSAVPAQVLEDRTLLSNIVWDNRGDVSDGFDAAFDEDAELAREVVDAALQDWEDLIVDFNYANDPGTNDLTMTIFMDPTLPAGTLGLSQAVVLDSVDDDGIPFGKPISGTLRLGLLDNDGDGDSDGWFIDPTPNDHSEFLGLADGTSPNITNAFMLEATPGGPADNLNDLYSLVIHEMGHAVGFGSTAGSDFQTSGLFTDTGIVDDSTTGNVANPNFYVFQGPSVNALLTAANLNSDAGTAVHTAGDRANNVPVQFNGQNFYGTRDIMNRNGVTNDRRALISNKLALMLQDVGYTINGLPEFDAHAYALLNETSGHLTIRGGRDDVVIGNVVQGSSDDTVIIDRFGNSLMVSVDIGVDIPGTGAGQDPLDQSNAFITFFNIGDISSISIDTYGGEDTIDIRGLADGMTLVINAGDDDDSITIGDGLLEDIESTVTTLGNVGNDTVRYNDSLHDSGEDYSLEEFFEGFLDEFERSGVGSFLHSAENVVIDGGSAADSYTLQGTVAANVTLNAGGGADDITVGDGDLDQFSGTVSINGGSQGVGQVDSLLVDDSLHAGAETYTINSGLVTRSGLPLFAFTFSAIETLDVEGGTSANTFNVNGTADGVDVTVTGGPSSDIFHVGNGDIDTNLGDGLLHIVGGAGDAVDQLILDDTLDTGNDSYFFDDNEFNKFNYVGTLTFAQIEHVNLDANHHNNQVHVFRTPTGTGLTINGGGGNNTVFAGNGDFDSNIRGDLTFNGGFDFDRFVILDNNDNVGNDTYVFYGPTDSSPATFDKTSYNWVASYSSFVNSVELEASDFNNTVFLNGAGVGAAVTLNMNVGDDTIHVGSGVLDDFAELITVDGGAGIDDITLHDETDTGDDTYWVGNNFALKSSGFSLAYENAETFTLNANPDQNTINVESVLATTPMWINAGASSDTIHLAPTAQQLSFIHAAVHVNGQDGVDNVFLHDELSNPLDPLPFAVTDDQVLRPPPPFRVPRFELNYEELERLLLQLGAADDLVDIQNTAPGMHVVVESGFGEDTVLADVPTPATLTFDGGADDDTVQLVGTAASEEISVSVGFGVADVNLISFEDASIDMAGGTDVLVYQGAPGVKEQVEVQSSTTAHQGALLIVAEDIEGEALDLDLMFLHTEILDLLANPGDLDTAAFVGTDQDDRFEIHLEAAGTNDDPVLQLFELDGVAPLLTLRDYRNFGTLQVRGEDGADLFNVYALPSGPGTGRNLSVDGGSPSGPGNPKDELNVYREFEQPPPPPNPGSNPGNESEGSIDVLYELFEFLIDFSEFEKVKVLSNNAAP